MKVEIGQIIDGLRINHKGEFDPTIILKLRYIKDNLPWRLAYQHYGWLWRTDSTHQLSCPFHARYTDNRGQPYEQHPSARYYEHDRQIWCFACTEGGDVGWFIKKHEQHENYGQTIQFIAQTFGVMMDNVDLTKRIAAFNKDQSADHDARRDLLSQMYTDKANDLFYSLRKQSDNFAPIADKLEPVVFARKAELDAFEGEYLAYARQVRRWLTWIEELIQDSLRHLVTANK